MKSPSQPFEVPLAGVGAVKMVSATLARGCVLGSLTVSQGQASGLFRGLNSVISCLNERQPLKRVTVCLLSSFHSLECPCLYNNYMVSALEAPGLVGKEQGREEGGQALSCLIPTLCFRVGPPKSLL